MNLFIEWAFGPERVFEAAKLVREAQGLISALAETPNDPSLHRTLRRELVALRDTADAHHWLEEGNVAAALARFPSIPDEARPVVPQLRSGLNVLQRLMQTRLASAIALNLGSMHGALRRAAA